MSLARAIKLEVLARQLGRCARGEACKLATRDGRGVDLLALKANQGHAKYLPRGRTLVEYDHVVPRCDGGTDAPENIEALCGWCHDDKTESERPEWRAATPSIFAERGIKPRATFRPAGKALRLRVSAPAKVYPVL